MKRRGCLIAVIVLVGLLGLACYGFVQFQRNFEMSFDSPYLFVSFGATEDNQAHFVESGFQDRGISFFVLRSSEPHATPKLVADLSCRPNCFDSAVWSRDGSVVACRSQVIAEEDIADSAEKKPPYTIQILYSCAYDFREGKSTVFRPTGLGFCQDKESHPCDIKGLLDSRGGLGKEITKREISGRQQKLNWAQWQVYIRARQDHP